MRKKKGGRSKIRRLEVSPEFLLWPFSGNCSARCPVVGVLDCDYGIVAAFPFCGT
jgi:hypothetical protein